MKNNIQNNKKIKFNIQGLTRLNEDACYKKINNKTILKSGNYSVKSYKNNDCAVPNVENISLKHPSFFYRDGYGWVSNNGCVVDNDSKLRNSRNLTNLNSIHQLKERLHKTTPFLINKDKSIPKETNLLHSESTLLKRPCNTLSGITIDRFIPQIPVLKENIQNPRNLIQEINNKNWIRGGQPSRQYIKTKEYLNKCIN
uniref:Uncharacterized protein n=1 Tax=viral metagenome TaxID=1070528 RepID=A0A6C0IWW3_9ZZZZ